MALTGTITVTTSGNAVIFSTGDPTFRAKSLFLYNLTAGNSFLLSLGTTTNTTGFTVPATTMMQFTELGGYTGFSVIASTAAGSMSVSFLASR